MNNKSVLFKLNADKINEYKQFCPNFEITQADFLDVAIGIISFVNWFCRSLEILF